MFMLTVKFHVYSDSEKDLLAFENAHGACLQLWIPTSPVEFVPHEAIFNSHGRNLYPLSNFPKQNFT